MRPPSPSRQLARFLAKYTPGVAATARAALRKLRACVPGAVELVYDNYNALVVAFGPSERPSELILSLALYPRWVTLFFAHGKGLPDPHGLLRGSGSRIRSVVLESAATLDRPAVKRLIRHALARATTPFDARARRRLVIKSVSKKQQPRRPA